MPMQVLEQKASTQMKESALGKYLGSSTDNIADMSYIKQKTADGINSPQELKELQGKLMDIAKRSGTTSSAFKEAYGHFSDALKNNSSSLGGSIKDIKIDDLLRDGVLTKE
jgi:hypothetical protein